MLTLIPYISNTKSVLGILMFIKQITGWIDEYVELGHIAKINIWKSKWTELNMENLREGKVPLENGGKCFSKKSIFKSLGTFSQLLCE